MIDLMVKVKNENQGRYVIGRLRSLGLMVYSNMSTEEILLNFNPELHFIGYIHYIGIGKYLWIHDRKLMTFSEFQKEYGQLELFP